MTKNYQTILDAFPLEGEVVSVEPFGNGHINDTLRVTVKNSDGYGADQVCAPADQSSGLPGRGDPAAEYIHRH